MSIRAASIRRGERKGLGKIASVFSAGTALFSDGYQNGVVGEINTLLKKLYPVEYTAQHSKEFSSVAFAGTVIGMLTFGYISDKVGRKAGMLIATLIVVVFAIALTGAYGASVTALLNALTAYRFLIGIGIGAEYPAGSVAAAEETENPEIKKGSQHMLFALATNVAIDFGFVVAAAVPLIFLLIFSENNLTAVWRMSFAFGVLPPLAVFFFRTKLTEPERYKKESMKNCKIPYWLVFKRYWKSFLGLAISWFIYDFISYPFGIYSSSIVEIIIGPEAPLSTTFAYNVLINAFYIPGCVIGALVVDRVGPKRMMWSMLILQAIVGFGMSGGYVSLTNNVAGFAVIYGIFLSLGEAGPGNCLGLLAAKSWPTAVRGQMYGLAAAVGKIGAFVGTYVFPIIIDSFPAGPAQAAGPFYVGSGLAVFSAIIVYFLIPEIPVDHMTNEDAAFRAYLIENNFDVSRMGLIAEADPESSETPELKDEKFDSVADVKVAESL